MPRKHGGHIGQQRRVGKKEAAEAEPSAKRVSAEILVSRLEERKKAKEKTLKEMDVKAVAKVNVEKLCSLRSVPYPDRFHEKEE